MKLRLQGYTTAEENSSDAFVIPIKLQFFLKRSKRPIVGKTRNGQIASSVSANHRGKNLPDFHNGPVASFTKQHKLVLTESNPPNSLTRLG